jgi:prepilin-type N-terminal cleavage/methylation domain-containing protein
MELGRAPIRVRSGARQRGFSLVEVLVAVALVGFALLAIAPLFTSSQRANAVGWDFSVLNTSAKGRLEELLQANFADARLAVPDGSTIGTTGVVGKLYVDETPNTRVVNGVTTSFPYDLVYTVQNFRLQDITDLRAPDPTLARTDASVDWNVLLDVKYITVYAGSGRRFLQGSSYALAPGFSSLLTGKQIRMSAIKAP